MSSVAGQPGVYSQSVRTPGAINPRFISRYAFYGGDYDSTLGDFRTQSVSGTGNHEFTFPIPIDLGTLTSIELVGIALGDNLNAPYDLTSDYGAKGQPYTQQSESALGLTIAVVNNQIFGMNLLPVLSAIVAGDWCGVRVNHTGWTFATRYLGIEIIYKT